MKSNATTTNYFTTFLQNVDLSSSYWFSSIITINITFLFINNHSTHQHFVNIFVKKFVSLTLFKYENVSILQNSISPIK